MLLAFVIPIRLFGRTIWLSTRLKLLTTPVTALPTLSDIVRLLTLSVAKTAAGPTLNIGRSIAFIVNAYIIVCRTPTKTEVPGIREWLSIPSMTWASVPLTMVVSSVMITSRTTPLEPAPS